MIDIGAAVRTVSLFTKLFFMLLLGEQGNLPWRVVLLALLT